ncbi:hypothetical protein D3C80_1780650 [compost metagenome]
MEISANGIICPTVTLIPFKLSVPVAGKASIRMDDKASPSPSVKLKSALVKVYGVSSRIVLVLFAVVGAQLARIISIRSLHEAFDNLKV